MADEVSTACVSRWVKASTLDVFGTFRIHPLTRMVVTSCAMNQQMTNIKCQMRNSFLTTPY